MNAEDIRGLNALNARFYGRFGTSFSATRQAPWAGWLHLADLLEADGRIPGGSLLHLMDVGAGNCRFERFLVERFPSLQGDFLLLDSAEEPCCTEAQKFAVPTRFVRWDCVEELLAVDGNLPAANADLTVAFGLAHHLPSAALRERFLRALVRATKPGGLVVVSFWQFLGDDGLAARAKESTAAAAPYLRALGINPECLEAGDCILGWQGASFGEGAMRFCHHFDDNEIHRLVCAVDDEAGLRARFSADGRNGGLNAYVVLER